MRFRNPKFKKSIRDDLLKSPLVKSEETAIKVPPKKDVKNLWWSKYEANLKNPKTK